MDDREYAPESADARDNYLDDDGGDDLDGESVVAYIVDEITRALGAHERAARGSVQRHLPLGEALALFNFADQFGLIDRVRADLDRRLGHDAYVAFSEAMKAALLDRGFGPGGGAPRPTAPRPNRPPDREPGGRPGWQDRPASRPSRGGGRPPGRDRRP